MEWADTHCHLNHADYDADRAAVQARALAAGVTRLLCIGWDIASSRAAARLAQASGLYAAIGIHPESAAEWGDEARAAFRELLPPPVPNSGGAESPPALNSGGARPKIVAYGEIGLDYHWETLPCAQQQTVFAEQIAFAASLSPALPLIIHCRDAFDDTLAVLRESQTPNPVVMHCFTGGTEAAEACLHAGYYLGIGGVATFKKSEPLREAIAAAPLEQLLLETDCPYLAPQPWRGKRNEPAYLPAVAQTIAVVKNLPIDTIAAVTTATARRLFSME